MELKRYKEAKRDIETILKLEPFNKEVKVFLNQVNERLENLKVCIL